MLYSIKNLTILKIQHKIFIYLFIIFFPCSILFAQDSLEPYDALGMDILISTNGIGLGIFFRHEYAENISGFIDFSISSTGDESENEIYDPYTGKTFIPGKINRFLVMPLFCGIQYRLFKDEIMDNFRPFISVAAGPSMIYVFPYDDEYFRAIGKGQARFTGGGYAGIGAFFGSERSTLLGINLRYYVIPHRSGIRSMWNKTKDQFGGFYISLSFGSAL